MEREITDPVGYRYILKVDANHLHIRRGRRRNAIVLNITQAQGLKAYLDKALRARPSDVVEDYDGLILRHDGKTSCIQVAQGHCTIEMFPPCWDALSNEIALLLPYLAQPASTASPAIPAKNGSLH